MASRTTAMVMALAWGCGSTTDVTLQLACDEPDCAAAFAKVRTMSLEAVANNGACRLAHECVFDVEAASIEDLESALRATGDILLELDPDVAQALKVNGRPLNDCFPRAGENDPVICGNANLDAASGGTLTVELHTSGCIESIPLCR